MLCICICKFEFEFGNKFIHSFIKFILHVGEKNDTDLIISNIIIKYIMVFIKDSHQTWYIQSL